MTPEEAIEILDNEYKRIELQIMSLKGTIKENTESFRYRIDVKESLKTAISALEEIQQYREIGTVEECREAMEKRKPKKPYHEEWIGIDGVPYDLCPNPNCRKNIYTTSSKISYCEHCGQAITWDKSSDTVGNKN